MMAAAAAVAVAAGEPEGRDEPRAAENPAIRFMPTDEPLVFWEGAALLPPDHVAPFGVDANLPPAAAEEAEAEEGPDGDDSDAALGRSDAAAAPDDDAASDDEPSDAALSDDAMSDGSDDRDGPGPPPGWAADNADPFAPRS
jgi:hypothetical protein